MSRYGLAGRALRSPLNPIWSLSQAPRFAGNAMAAATPAAAALGDQFVDKVSPQLSEMAGGLAQDVLGKGKYADMLTGLARDGAPMAAKLGGRLAWGGAAGLMGGLGDIGSGESPMRSMNNVMRGQMMAGMPTSPGSPQAPRVGAEVDDDDYGPFRRAPNMEMGPPVPPDLAQRSKFMTGGVANVTGGGGPQAGMMGGMGMPLPPPGNPATDNWDIGHWHPAVPQPRRKQPGIQGTGHQPQLETGSPYFEPGTMTRGRR